jgi:hypothetical protein
VHNETARGSCRFFHFLEFSNIFVSIAIPLGSKVDAVLSVTALMRRRNDDIGQEVKGKSYFKCDEITSRVKKIKQNYDTKVSTTTRTKQAGDSRASL